MAESSGFFPDISGDRSYTSDWLAKYIASFLGNGVYSGELGAAADGGAMAVVLPSGRAWINGYHYRNDGALTLAIDNADGVLNRIDLLVLRWDVNARSITAQVVKGTPAGTAAAPAVVRTAEQYDLKLAEISVPAGTTAVTQSLITDTRLDKSVCGIVTGMVDQVDTTTFYNQIKDDLAHFKSGSEADFTSWSAEQKASFQTWLDGIKNALDGDTAGNLLNLINAHKADQTVHVTTLACAKSGTVYALTGLTASSGKVRVMFSVPSAYTAGDTVTIDGTAYTLTTTDGSALTSGAWAAGAMITATADVENKALHVRPPVPHTKADIGLGNVDNTADADKAVKYATYSSHAVSSSGSAVRNNTISSSMPTGGQDGDTWDVYDT